MGNCWLAVNGGQRDGPHSEGVAGHGHRGAIPVVCMSVKYAVNWDGTEIAHEVGCDGIGSPFAVGDIAVGGNVEAHLVIALCEIGEAALGFVECVDPGHVGAVAMAKGGRVGLQPWIDLDNAGAVLSRACCGGWCRCCRRHCWSRCAEDSGYIYSGWLVVKNTDWGEGNWGQRGTQSEDNLPG
jgi:hypothetical protein